MSFEENSKVKVIQYFAKNYIESSMIFSRNAQIVEMKDSHDYYDKSNHQANVTGAIIFSVLYLESTINEFFININDFIDDSAGKKSDNRKILSELWRTDIFSKTSVLDKYRYALIMLSREKFNESINPFQNIKTLISFRNYLVHYRPKWLELKTSENDKVQMNNLEKMLSGKFELNKIIYTDNDFFPIKFMGYGCTKWAISNSIQFVYEFYKKVDMEYIFKEIINALRNNYGV